MMYELRTYHAMPGRLPDLNKRFAEITLDFFKKHGIDVVGLVGFVGQRPPAIPEHTHSADAAAFPPTLRPTVIATTSGSTALFIVNGATFRTYFV